MFISVQNHCEVVLGVGSESDSGSDSDRIGRDLAHQSSQPSRGFDRRPINDKVQSPKFNSDFGRMGYSTVVLISRFTL